MANEVAAYAQGLRDALIAEADAQLQSQLTELVTSAQQLDAALIGGVVTLADAQARWEAARDEIAEHLKDYLLGVLAAIPGLADLAGDLSELATQGIHGEVDLGPVHLSVASSTLVVQPPKLPDGTVPPPIPIGPFQVGEIAAKLSSPFGGGLPGGGSILRLPATGGSAGGYGGTLEIPLGPVQITASAVLAVIDGQPSFLAILGISFLPPIQLSFGFSLDRVGGIVGVNRRADVDRLRAAVKTGTAGDVLFAVRPPSSPLALVTAADQLFPAQVGTHLVGPSLRVSWLSFGPAGSLISLDLGVVVEIPTGKVIILGVARVAIPGLDFLLNLRLDLLGVIDPPQQLLSIDASLVDSHALGIFEIYGDGALRFSWGDPGYFVASVGGFYPGFDPEPAKIPALRRIGMAIDNPIPIIDLRAEGYFAITSNAIQFGARLETGIDLVIQAHGFIQVDAIVQFRPFHFEADISAGFDVSVEGFSFASVTLSGSISGPGPVVIRGSLSIDVFLFSISWDQTFTLGDGPSDTLPTPPRLLDAMAEELGQPANVHTGSIGDPQVVLAPRPAPAALAVVPPTGTLRLDQHRAPLGLLIERLDGRPLDGQQGAMITTAGSDVTERFAPGSYVDLTSAEAMNRPPFDLLPAGRELSPADPPPFDPVNEDRAVQQIVISGAAPWSRLSAAFLPLAGMAALTEAARRPPATSDQTAMITVTQEQWTTLSGGSFSSATAAHQQARYHGGIALAEADAAVPVSLAGVL